MLAHLQDRLSKLLSNSQTLLVLMQDILVCAGPPRPDPLIVHLPPFARDSALQFQEMLADHARHVIVKHVSATDRFAVEWGQELWEFDVSATSQTLASDALERLWRTEATQATCQATAVESMEFLTNALTEYITSLKRNP
jgi:hypothetical protein